MQGLFRPLRGVKRLRKGLCVGRRRHWIELRVRVAGATRAGVGDEQEVELVLWVIVVSAPAVPEDWIRALGARVEERRAVLRRALHVHAKVFLPLRGEVVTH